MGEGNQIRDPAFVDASVAWIQRREDTPRLAGTVALCVLVCHG